MKFISRFETPAWALTAKPQGGSGLGLISMEERLKLVEGKAFHRIAAKAGYHDHARVPLSSGNGFVRG